MGWARHFSLSDLARRTLATSDRLLWRAARSLSRTGWTGWAGLVGLSNYFGCPKTFFKKVLAKPARLPYSNFSREGAQRRSKLGLRLVVGQRILVPSTGVRLSQSQPFATSTHMARSSSGSGRRPLKAEITSSNLVRATTHLIPGLLTEVRVFYYRTNRLQFPFEPELYVLLMALTGTITKIF